jgi:8-oxo-dGTP diphosphatase
MTQATLPRIHVTCAVIERDGLILAAQRSASMSMPLKWEFPGGKIKTGESPEDCLKREILEELTLRITLRGHLEPYTHHYPGLSVTLYPFICGIDSGTLVPQEHSSILWLPRVELPELDWAEADIFLMDRIARWDGPLTGL